MADSQRSAHHIAITPVKPDRQEDFERFIRDVIVPAVRDRRPDLVGSWQTLRPADTEGGSANYAFVFYGDFTADDWDLEPVFESAYGAEQGQRYIEQFAEMLVSDQQMISFSGDIPSE